MKKTIKKLTGIFTAMTVTLTAAAFTVTAGAAQINNSLLVADGDVKMVGSAVVEGNALMSAGNVTAKGNSRVSGTIYLADGATADKNLKNVETYSGEAPDTAMPEVADAPEADSEYFASSQNKDGAKNYVLGWGTNDNPDNSSISENSYFNNLYVPSSLNLNLVTEAGKVLVIRAHDLAIDGKITVVGDGSVVIYTDNIAKSKGGVFNPSKASNVLSVVLNSASDVSVDNFVEFNANVYAPKANVNLSNVKRFTGNIYAGKSFEFKDSGTYEGLFFAPNSNTILKGSAWLKGELVTKTLDMSGSTGISLGSILNIGDNVSQIIFGKPQGGTDEPNPPTPPQGQGDVEITVVVPRRMSIRLEDGTVLKNGSSFKMEKEGTVKFQMCTNNWDTDSYTDDGNGIAGTKVYEYTHKAKSDNTLRVDTNTYFMAVRFHFVKGDYMKQTGIKNVLSTPLESLSVNLPLGSTISADAYVGGKVVSTENVFVETAADKTICYTDYSWNY